MGPKTVTRLVILIAIVIVASLSIFFLQRSQVTRMAKSVLEEAQEAEKGGGYEAAIQKYQEHLLVVPGDDVTKAKLADVLLKGGKDFAKQAQAAQLYGEILTRNPQRADIRRRLAELSIERSLFKEARLNVEILLKNDPSNGDLLFMRGRCEEVDEDFAEAEKSYKTAVENGASQRVEAIQRRANLLRGPLKQADEADRIIDKMVSEDPENDQVYLARGRYRRRFKLPGADADFRRVLKSTNGVEVNLELAELAAAESNFDEARRVLQSGLAVAPKDPMLHQAQANLELRSGSASGAVASLNKSLGVMPDNVGLRWMLANLLAEQGKTTELMDQIQELRRLSFTPTLLEFLEASHEVNSSQWTKAIQSLSRLQPILEPMPELKARVNALLARCYDHQGDPERLRDALQRAVRANPSYLPALISNLVERGELNQAIDESRKLAQAAPATRTSLIELLIARNRQQPEGQRDWREVEELLKQEAAVSPKSAEPLLLRAEMAAARGNIAEAQALSDSARKQFPRDVRSWVASADLLRQRGKFEPAGALLDQAQQALGDSVKLRRERARVLVSRGGTDLVERLDELSRNTTAFPPQDRQRFLKTMGEEIGRLEGGLTAAARIWTEVAALDPNAIEPLVQRLEIAFQAATNAEDALKKKPDQAAKDGAAGARAEIERIIAEIGRIEGTNGLNTRYQEARYRIWQARYAATAADKQTLRNAARSLIDDLSSRRPDWSLIPLARATIVEQEIQDETEKLNDAARTSDDEAKKTSQKRIKGLQEAAANFYISAVEQGQTNLAIVRRATDLLYATGRSTEVSQLWSRLPAGSIVGGGLQDQAAVAALRNRDFQRALELTSQAVEEHPNDFRERFFLAQVLRLAGKQAEAVAELRKGVDLAPTDPDRWLNLILFLVQGGQLEDAEKVIPQAEAALPKDKAPLYLARYCRALGLAYQEKKQEAQKTKWCDAANSWFKKAREATPGDPSVTRTYTEYLIRTGQIKEVEAHLKTTLARAPLPENMEEISLARRTLAAILMSRNDFQASREALKLFEPNERGGAGQGLGEQPPLKPEDLQTLARVYAAQGSSAYLKKAITTLEKLMATGLANPDDRNLLARLYSGDGDWPKARDQYRAMAAQVASERSGAIPDRHVGYLVQYATELLKHFQAAPDQETLIDAQELAERVRVFRPDSLDLLMLEARIQKARNEISKAVELIEAGADRPKLPPGELLRLSMLAEEIGQPELAERQLKKLFSEQDRLEYRLPLVRFLARTGQVGAALDLCEQLWKGAASPDALVPSLLDVALSDKTKDGTKHLDRVADWLQKGLEQRPKSSILMLGLGNLRERQGKFAEAAGLYHRDIDQGGGNKMVALNNLAWLMALGGEEADGTALKLINQAINRTGPSPELLDTRGIVYLKSGDVEHALEDLKQAVDGAPTAAKYFHLAQAYLAAKAKDEAKQALDKALDAGLTQDSLHAMEIRSYKEVLDALGVRSSDRGQSRP